MAPSSAGNPSWEENFLSNRPLQDWLRRIKEVSRQKYAVLSQPECTHLQACNAMPLLPLHTHQSEGRSTKHSLPYSNDGLFAFTMCWLVPLLHICEMPVRRADRAVKQAASEKSQRAASARNMIDG